MTSHTPGPWTIRKLPSDLSNNPERFRIEGKTTLLLDVAPCADGFVEGENKANAYLIAAAPELLEALLVVDSWMDATAKQLGITTIHTDVKSAIAKATGAIP